MSCIGLEFVARRFILLLAYLRALDGPGLQLRIKAQDCDTQARRVRLELLELMGMMASLEKKALRVSALGGEREMLRARINLSHGPSAAWSSAT
jgi:hypothetical protein